MFWFWIFFCFGGVVIFYFLWNDSAQEEDDHTCSICRKQKVFLTHQEMLKHAEIYHCNQLSHIIYDAFDNIEEILLCKESKDFCIKRVHNSVVLWDMTTPISAKVLMKLLDKLPSCILRLTIVVVHERAKYETWDDFAQYGNFNNILLAYCFPRSKKTLYIPEAVSSTQGLVKGRMDYDDEWRCSWEEEEKNVAFG